MHFSDEQIYEAKHTDLHDYLLANHEDDFLKEGGGIRWAADKKVWIGRGSYCYMDWGKGRGGDAIDFLRTFYGYSFGQAVRALLEGDVAVQAERLQTDGEPSREKESEEEGRSFHIPTRRPYYNNHVYAYLTRTRGIPGDTVSALIRKGLLYQDVYNNAVFINRTKDRCEIVGTNTNGERYRRTRCKSGDRFWYFGKKTDTIFLAEGAIDAISLFELTGRRPALYGSLAGVSNQKIIDRILKLGKYHIILAVDNDEAGQECRERNPESDMLTHLIPQNCKDWNDELMLGYTLEDCL